MAVDSGPDVLVLDQLERQYLPVRFDHKAHARMADMSEGCETCHHFSPAGTRPPPCASCHDPGAAGTDPRKPGLKGAYHQQCLNCHREWVDETACEVCHLARENDAAQARVAAFPTIDRPVLKPHPPILKPAGDIYEGYSSDRDSRVVFRHEQHTSRFGLACVECHHEPSCARCHYQKNGTAPKRSVQEHHRPCDRCHKRDMDLAGRDAGRCEKCHWLEGAPRPLPFDHASVGWPLGRFHERVGCRRCHAAATPFQRVDRRCESCHANWSPATFRHEVTGTELGKVHAPLDCDVCHRDRRFDMPAGCEECHEEAVSRTALLP
ncbi:MAG: cytochrome c3 family protein [Planctomycetes bacterium]|nr:cytochrome c3 family protein [Planctomycetota bacterium]